MTKARMKEKCPSAELMQHNNLLQQTKCAHKKWLGNSKVDL